MTTDDEARENIAANLHRILAERNLSQSELARRTGDPVMTINGIFHGKHVAGAGILTRIAEALDVSIDRLTAKPSREKFPAAS